MSSIGAANTVTDNSIQGGNAVLSAVSIPDLAGMPDRDDAGGGMVVRVHPMSDRRAPRAGEYPEGGSRGPRVAAPSTRWASMKACSRRCSVRPGAPTA